MEGIQVSQVQPQVVLVYNDNDGISPSYTVKRTVQMLEPKVGSILTAKEVQQLMTLRPQGRTVKVVTEIK